MRVFRLLFLFMLFQLYAVHDSEAQFIGFFLEDNEKKVSFEFELHNNLIVVPVKLEGRLPLRFILDTGVSSAIIFERHYTDILGIEYSRKISIMGVGKERAIEAFVATDVKMDLPGIVGFRQSILVLSDDYLQLKHQLGTEVHGILGYELFRKFVVEINYDDKIITVYDHRFHKPKRRWVEFPLEIISTKPYLRFPVWTENQRVDGNFMVDTGASHAVLIQEKSDERLFIPEKKLRASLGKGLSGDIHGYMARVKKLKIGDFEFNDVIASFPDEASYGDSLLHVEKNGTLGGEILSRFSIAFDYMGGSFYMRKGSQYKKDFEYNMSGIEVSAFGPKLDVLKVSNVRAGSPADSVGVKEEDILLSINGLSGEALTISNAYKMFNSKPGKKLRLILLREEEKVKKVLILQQAI